MELCPDFEGTFARRLFPSEMQLTLQVQGVYLAVV